MLSEKLALITSEKTEFLFLNLIDSPTGANVYLTTCNGKYTPENVKHIVSTKKKFLKKNQLAISTKNEHCDDYLCFLLDHDIIEIDYINDYSYYICNLTREYKNQKIIS